MQAIRTIVIFEEEGKDLASPDKLAIKDLTTNITTYPGEIRRPKQEDTDNLINQMNLEGYSIVGIDHSDRIYMSKISKVRGFA